MGRRGCAVVRLGRWWLSVLGIECVYQLPSHLKMRSRPNEWSKSCWHGLVTGSMCLTVCRSCKGEGTYYWCIVNCGENNFRSRSIWIHQCYMVTSFRKHFLSWFIDRSYWTELKVQRQKVWVETLNGYKASAFYIISSSVGQISWICICSLLMSGNKSIRNRPLKIKVVDLLGFWVCIWKAIFISSCF